MRDLSTACTIGPLFQVGSLAFVPSLSWQKNVLSHERKQRRFLHQVVSIGAEGPSDHGFHPSDAEIDLFRTQNGRCVHLISRPAKRSTLWPGMMSLGLARRKTYALKKLVLLPAWWDRHQSPHHQHRPHSCPSRRRYCSHLLQPVLLSGKPQYHPTSKAEAEAEAESPQDNIANITVAVG